MIIKGIDIADKRMAGPCGPAGVCALEGREDSVKKSILTRTNMAARAEPAC